MARRQIGAIVALRGMGSGATRARHMTNWQKAAAEVDADTRSDALIPALVDAAVAAGELALRFFRPGAETSADVQHKAGGSPVTEADLLVDGFLREHLGQLLPEAGWLSEETADSHARLDRRRVLIVDPIDGTRGYAAGDARWAVSIALVEDGRPIAGVVHAPAMGETFTAERGGGAFLTRRRSRFPLAPGSICARASPRPSRPRPSCSASACCFRRSRAFRRWRCG